MTNKMILNEPLPEDLRQELEADAREKGISLNEAAVVILSNHYEIQWEPRGVYRPTSTERFKLRVPEDLHRAIRIDAAKELLTVRGIALNILSQHYGTDTISPERRPRKEVA